MLPPPPAPLNRFRNLAAAPETAGPQRARARSQPRPRPPAPQPLTADLMSRPGALKPRPANCFLARCLKAEGARTHPAVNTRMSPRLRVACRADLRPPQNKGSPHAGRGARDLVAGGRGADARARAAETDQGVCSRRAAWACRCCRPCLHKEAGNWAAVSERWGGEAVDPPWRGRSKLIPGRRAG